MTHYETIIASLPHLTQEQLDYLRNVRIPYLQRRLYGGMRRPVPKQGHPQPHLEIEEQLEELNTPQPQAAEPLKDQHGDPPLDRAAGRRQEGSGA